MEDIDVLKTEALPAVDVAESNALKVSDETLIRLGLHLQSRFKKLRDLRERSDWERDKAKAFQAYHLIPTQRELPFDGAANLPCPFVRIGVDSFHANVMASAFPKDNQMSVVPLLIQKDFATTAGKAAKYMTYVMNHEADFYTVFDDADRKSHLFGIGYLEPSYVREVTRETVEVTKKVKIPTPDPLTGEIKFKEKTTTKVEKKKRVVFDGTKVESLPVESIYKNPFLLTLEQCVKDDVVFKRVDLTWDKILERSKSREDSPAVYLKSEVDRLRPYATKKVVSRLSDLEMERAKNDGFYLDTLIQEEILEMAQAYLWYDVDGDDIKEEVTVVFHPESGIVVRVALNKCRIVELSPRPIDGRGYGDNFYLMCRGIADEWENLHNTRSNAGQWEHMPFGFYRAGGRFNPQQFRVKPGHFYPVDNPAEVSFPRTQMVGQSYFEEERILWDIFQRIVAVDENMQGASARRRTATEAMNVSSRASIRFGNPFNRTVTALNKLLDHIWELNQICSPPDKEFFVIGEGGVAIFDKMEAREFSSKMRFSLAVSSVFDKQMIRDSMLLAYRLFLVNPFVQQHPETMWELSQKTLDTLDIDMDLPKPPQAKVVSAFEALEMVRQGKPVEPEPGIDVDHHMQVFMGQLNADEIENWEPDAVMRLVMYIDKLKILKQTLEAANLNKSGLPVPQGAGPQPGVTASRNPNQRMNTMRVNESAASARNNAKQAPAPQPQGQPQVNDQAMAQILGNQVS